MKNLRKRTFALFSVLIVITIASVGVISSYASAPTTPNASNAENLFKFGEIERESANSKLRSGEVVAIKGDHIEVYEHEILKIARRYEVTNTPGAIKLATDFLTKREVLYYAALQAGCTTTTEEVYAMIELQKEEMKQATNYSDFFSMLDGADMTIDEYWETQFDIIKKDIVLSQYIGDVKTEFFKDKRLTDYSDEENANMWNNEYERIVNQLKAQENLVVLKSVKL